MFRHGRHGGGASGLTRDAIREELQHFSGNILQQELLRMADRIERTLGQQLRLMFADAGLCQNGEPMPVPSGTSASSSSPKMLPTTSVATSGISQIYTSNGGGLQRGRGVTWARELDWISRPRKGRNTRQQQETLAEESFAPTSSWPASISHVLQSARADTLVDQPGYTRVDTTHSDGNFLELSHNPDVWGGNESQNLGVRSGLSTSLAPHRSTNATASLTPSAALAMAKATAAEVAASTTNAMDESHQARIEPWRRRKFSGLSSAFSYSSRASRPTSSNNHGTSFRRPMLRLVTDVRFTYCVGLCILLNAIAMGWQADYTAKHWSVSTPKQLVFLGIDAVFCVIFGFELTVRISAYGKRFFKVGSWVWNIFDLFMVLVQCMECSCSVWSTLLSPATKVPNKIGAIGIMRVFRIFRVLRLVRFISVFSELRMFLVSVTDSMWSLFRPVLFIMLLTIYTGAVYLTELVTEYAVHNPEKTNEIHELQRYYGSLSRSMLTLYESISSGVSWDVVMSPLSNYCTRWMEILFPIWVGFALFAMLNVITGIFCETALQTASEDKKKLLLHELSQWFHEIDAAHTGTVSEFDFLSHVDNPKMQRFLKIVDLDDNEAWALFKILDVNENGEVDIDDFVNGLLRIVGEAKAIDLVTLMHQYKLNSSVVNQQQAAVTEALERLEAMLAELAVHNGRQ